MHHGQTQTGEHGSIRSWSVEEVCCCLEAGSRTALAATQTSACCCQHSAVCVGSVLREKGALLRGGHERVCVCVCERLRDRLRELQSCCCYTSSQLFTTFWDVTLSLSAWCTCAVISLEKQHKKQEPATVSLRQHLQTHQNFDL